MFELPDVNRDHAKYTKLSHEPPVRSTSIAVLSLNFPDSGDDEPLATVVVPAYSRPSRAVGPFAPSGLTNRATHWSPKPFAVPAGAPHDSEAKNPRPWVSHATTGAPPPAVRICARAADGDRSPG